MCVRRVNSIWVSGDKMAERSWNERKAQVNAGHRIGIRSPFVGIFSLDKNPIIEKSRNQYILTSMFNVPVKNDFCLDWWSR